MFEDFVATKVQSYIMGGLTNMNSFEQKNSPESVSSFEQCSAFLLSQKNRIEETRTSENLRELSEVRGVLHKLMDHNIDADAPK